MGAWRHDAGDVTERECPPDAGRFDTEEHLRSGLVVRQDDAVVRNGLPIVRIDPARLAADRRQAAGDELGDLAATGRRLARERDVQVDDHEVAGLDRTWRLDRTRDREVRIGPEGAGLNGVW